MNKIDQILSGKGSGKELIQASKDNYVAWCAPGVPFQAADLAFAIKGINGATPEETVDLVRTAAEFSRLVNSIPSSNVIGGTFEQAGNSVWDIYADVLRFSKVPDNSLTDDEKAKIAKFRGLLVATKKVKDIITDEETEIAVDSAMVVAYNEMMAAYQDAVLNYNNKRLSALNADTKQAVQDFTINGTLYRQQVQKAMNDWQGKGYKEDFEKIAAYIRHVSQRDMTLLKADLQDKFEKGKMTDPTSGGEFYMTSVYPGSFVNSDKGWTQFTFDAKSKDTYLKESHQSTGGSAGGFWSLFSFGANAKHSKDELKTSMESSDFEMSFKITQVPLGRPWFSPDFLTNNSWTWDQSIHKLLSDGLNPPTGRMIAYPTTAVFVKDVVIRSSALKETYSEIKSSVDAGGRVGWGPFSLSANHSQNSKEVKSSFNSATNTLTVEGMQLIAFKCFALPKAPDCQIENMV